MSGFIVSKKLTLTEARLLFIKEYGCDFWEVVIQKSTEPLYKELLSKKYFI